MLSIQDGGMRERQQVLLILSSNQRTTPGFILLRRAASRLFGDLCRKHDASCERATFKKSKRSRDRVRKIAAPRLAPPKLRKKAWDRLGARNPFCCQENLERAKGLEPSTPTLARLRSRLGNRIRSQFGTEKATKFLPLGGEPGALASLQIP